jgi:hypothetical protein
MKSRHNRTSDTGGAHRRPRRGAADDRAAAQEGGGSPDGGGAPAHWADSGADGAQAAPRAPQNGPAGSAASWPSSGEAVARRTATGWRVGDEEVSDLTSAMVLADLLAADLPTQAMPAVGALATGDGEPPDPKRLQETVAQLEHALTARVRVEQAIGVLAERHRLRPRQAFELLRSVARARGRRVMEIATEVVDSATNPLLRIPEELAKPPVTRRRGNRQSAHGQPGLSG